MNNGYSLSAVWDVLTRPNYIGAVLVIVFLQYRSNVPSFVYTAMNDGILQTFLNLILNLADIMRGYYHISREIIRSFGQNYVFDRNDGGNYARYPLPHGDSSHAQNYDSMNGPGRNGNVNRKRHSSYGPPPPLVVVRNPTFSTKNGLRASTTDASPGIGTTTSITARVGKEIEPLEPAFLNDDDYPPGWLVYHPVLRVSSIKEADRYDKQQLLRMRKEKQPQEQENEQLHLQKKFDHESTNESDITVDGTKNDGIDKSISA